jgi:hypothetical protein
MAENNFPLVGASLMMSSRGLSRVEAAAYVGLSPSRFGAARREGKYPNATLGRCLIGLWTGLAASAPTQAGASSRGSASNHTRWFLAAGELRTSRRQR